MANKDIKVTTIYLEKELYTHLRYIAATKDVKVNDCIKEALYEYVKKNKQLMP